MITKAQLLDSLRHETAVIKHLATKIPDGSLDYRPTPGQRSLVELLQYMTRMAAVPTIFTISGNWAHAEAMEKECESVTPENFATEMDRQLAIMVEAISDVDEAEATTAPSSMPWGAPTTVAAGLMDMTLKCMVAYRMQLFLYIKACGVSEIGPANCWAGVDMPPQED